MKWTRFNSRHLFALLALTAIMTSCSEDKEEDQPTFTEEQAVEVISESIKENTGGLAKDVASMSAILHGNALFSFNGDASNLSCGVPFDTTVTYTLSGSATGSITHQLNIMVSCFNGVPQSLNVIATHTGSYSGPNLTQASQGGRMRTWTGLQPESDTYVLNGNSNRNGTRTYLAGNQNTFNRSIESSITDLTVNKETGTITGGYGEATVTLTSSNGNTWVRESTIVFNGDGTATITINGNVYTITIEG